jgi:hydroxymethylglutaryl-CoA reductase
MNNKNSTLSKFYRKSTQERQTIIKDWANLDNQQIKSLEDSGLSLQQANHMVENVIGRYSLPFGIATNFLINQHNYLIPMVIEEPSVIAACSFAAKLFREAGGFIASSNDSIMIGQIQVLDILDIKTAKININSNKERILIKANDVGGSIVKRGGGAKDIEIREFYNTSIGDMLILHLIYDTQDAMGANAINTALEHIAPYIEELTLGRVNLRILSNLTDKRKAYAEGVIPKNKLATDSYSGEEAVQSIIEAGVFAEVDPYRATTHNKGIMNGIDAVLIATGNDWRAVEAGAHAYAVRDGSYTSLTKWSKTEGGDLHGRIELPLAVGIVGGATRVHPLAQTSLQILGIKSASQLAEIIACVGLAQNFAAIRALATEGIQQGHMKMHARQLAVAAGANLADVQKIAQQMIKEKNIRLELAKELVQQQNESETDES